MKFLQLVFLLLLFCSCATMNTAPIPLFTIGKIEAVLIPHVNWIHFYKGGLSSNPSMNPIELKNAILKAKEWQTQAIAKNVNDFSKEIDSWTVDHVSLEFKYTKKNSLIMLCGAYGSALQLMECDSIPSSRYEEIISILDTAPALIQKAKDDKETSKAFK